MATERICSSCHKPLGPDAPQGLCPECLMKAGFGTGAAPEPGQPSRAPAFTAPPVAELAKLFPQLEVLELLGQGGMGAVYKARQPALDRFVALKILPPQTSEDPGFTERFTREARALARLSHPNIVAVHDFGQAGPYNYFIMEFVDGANLRQMERAGKLTPREALQVVPQICEALQFAHDEGIVHRDIKPENILVDKRGRVKIADFGIAKLLGQPGATRLTGAKEVVGTPHYMAPEQVEKPAEVDHRADIYSLGVVFYEMLTGELPLGRFAPPSRKVQVDVRLDEVVLQTLEKEPERRYQQASQVKTAVETIAETPPPLEAGAAGNAGTTPPPGTPPHEVASGAGSPEERAARGRNKVTAPAIGLMVAAGSKLFSGIIVLLFLGIPGAGSSSVNWLRAFLDDLGLGGLSHWSLLALASIILFKVVPAVLVLYGALQMLRVRSYAWAVAAGVVAIVGCSFIGLPMGIWALLVLRKPDVKEAFGVDPPFTGTAPARPDRRGGAWSAVTVIIVLLVFCGIALSVLGLAAAVVLPNFMKTATSQPADVYREFNMSFPLTPDGRFSIDNVNGRIEISGWDRNEVVVRGAIHGSTKEAVDAIKTDTDSTTNRVVIHTRQPSNRNGFSFGLFGFNKTSARVDYTVQVPRHARLSKLSSVNGELIIADVAGDIEGSTVNGKMQVKGAAGDLKLSTVNGRIAAELASLGNSQSVSLDAVNGQIQAGLPTEADATLSAESVNGSISSEFPSLRVTKTFPVGSKLEGKLGAGSAKVKASTVNGSIHIQKNSAATRSGQTQSGGKASGTVSEFPRLEAEGNQPRVTGEQAVESRSATGNTPDAFTQSVLALSRQAAELKERLAQNPDKSIPELQFLGANDWLDAAKDARFDTDTDVRKALSQLRSIAKSKMPMGSALHGFIQTNGGQLPTDLSQLKPYFQTPADIGVGTNWSGVGPVSKDAFLSAIFERYKLVHSGNITNLPPDAWMVVEKAPVDKEYDSRAKFGNGRSTVISTGRGESGDPDDRAYGRVP